MSVLEYLRKVKLAEVPIKCEMCHYFYFLSNPTSLLVFDGDELIKYTIDMENDYKSCLFVEMQFAGKKLSSENVAVLNDCTSFIDKQVKSIISGSEAKIIKNICDYAKLDRGKITTQKEVFRLLDSAALKQFDMRVHSPGFHSHIAEQFVFEARNYARIVEVCDKL